MFGDKLVVVIVVCSLLSKSLVVANFTNDDVEYSGENPADDDEFDYVDEDPEDPISTTNQTISQKTAQLVNMTKWNQTDLSTLQSIINKDDPLENYRDVINPFKVSYVVNSNSTGIITNETNTVKVLSSDVTTPTTTITTTTTMSSSAETTKKMSEIVNLTTAEFSTTISPPITTVSSTTTNASKKDDLAASFNWNYLYFLLLIPIGLIIIGVYCFQAKKKKRAHNRADAIKRREKKRLSTPSWVFKEPIGDEEASEDEKAKC